MELTFVDRPGLRCLEGGVDCALLYAANLTRGFFDLSSEEAGAILQQLRNYGIRLAVVCVPGTARGPAVASGAARPRAQRVRVANGPP